MEIFEIMDKKSSNKTEVYLYEENGKWYAHERSASFLMDLKNTIRSEKQHHFFYEAMKEKLEVDLNLLLDMNWFVALCSDTEIMLIKTD